jgi:hypothetical protein
MFGLSLIECLSLSPQNFDNFVEVLEVGKTFKDVKASSGMAVCNTLIYVRGNRGYLGSRETDTVISVLLS